MKIMATAFKRSRAHTAALSAPSPAAGHRQPTPPLETPGHSRASLGQSHVGSLLLSPGSWCTQGSVYALQESVSQSCVSSGGSMVGLLATSSKNNRMIISKANHSLLEESKSMSLPVMLKKLKLNGSMKTYKTF